MVVDVEVEEEKAHVLQLMQNKDKIEAELKSLQEILETQHVDMSVDLVDSEGYPRQDIDVYQVRHARHKIICLQNDHKELMAKIEQGLHKIHSRGIDSTVEPNSSTATNNLQDVISSEPFVRVNLVSPGSPAELAGIKVGDLILEFGSINYQNFKSLGDIGSLVENSRYKIIIVKVKRGSSSLTLTLTPKPWIGKGLLGCNVVLLEAVER